jgi:hypothetical protein
LIEKVRKYDALMTYDYLSKKNREETITRGCYQLNKHLGVKDQSVTRDYDKLVSGSSGTHKQYKFNDLSWLTKRGAKGADRKQ